MVDAYTYGFGGLILVILELFAKVLFQVSSVFVVLAIIEIQENKVI
jgi:hypothetical protein